MNETWPTDNPLWDAFVFVAKPNSISLMHSDDWGPWWGMFLAGAKAVRDKDAKDERDKPGRAYMENG